MNSKQKSKMAMFLADHIVELSNDSEEILHLQRPLIGTFEADADLGHAPSKAPIQLRDAIVRVLRGRETDDLIALELAPAEPGV